MEQNVELTINGKMLHLELGHTEEEWRDMYGSDNSLWDIALDDYIEGAIEPNEDITYWYINGRLYETE